MRPEAAPCEAVRKAFAALIALVLGLSAVAGNALAEDYRLQAGDVVEVLVAGMPEMAARSSIQMDGSLSFPTVGVIDAAGFSISEIRERIRVSLSSRLLMLYLPDGNQVTRMVDRDEVSASVVEYRPVFVSGDVTQPGERPFRPGMTARQAIAASGGVITLVPVATGYNPAGLRAEYSIAWHAAVAAGARVWRLRKELGEDVTFDPNLLPPAPDAGAAIDRVLDVETDILRMRAQNYRHEGAFLVEQLEQIEAQAKALEKQLEVDKSVEQTDAEALAKATEASEKGILTQARLQDIRSGALFSSTRRLQTEVSLMQLERRRTEIARESNRRAEERRLDLLDEVQKAWIVEGQERARLSGAEEKLRMTGMAVGPVDDGSAVAQISIIRGGAEVPGPVTYDTKIEPGDVVEVKKSTSSAKLSTLAGPDQTQGMRTAAALR